MYEAITTSGSDDSSSAATAAASVAFAVGADDDGDDGEGSASMTAAEAAALEEMRVFESYVTGMLTNFDSLPLSRIHNMLKMFCMHGEHRYDKTEGQLATFLRRLVQDEKLKNDGGVFSLRK